MAQSPDCYVCSLLGDPENYDISTFQLKAERSASELQVRIYKRMVLVDRIGRSSTSYREVILPLNYTRMVGWRGFDPLPHYKDRFYRPITETIRFAFPLSGPRV